MQGVRVAGCPSPAAEVTKEGLEQDARRPPSGFGPLQSCAPGSHRPNKFGGTFSNRPKELRVGSGKGASWGARLRDWTWVRTRVAALRVALGPLPSDQDSRPPFLAALLGFRTLDRVALLQNRDHGLGSGLATQAATPRAFGRLRGATGASQGGCS